ncbi:MAG: anthranilate phosphoribosyltransferase [Flavobacteriales bacterium AspAUS03]
MKDLLHYLFAHKTLSKEEAQSVLIDMSRDQFNAAQLAALATVYNMRPPTLEEIKGFRQALLELCVKLDLSEFYAIDIVGTGGDRKNTFNISTLACFIVAGAGSKVIKHGNYSASSVTGSSNLLNQLGYVFTNEEGKLKKQLEIVGICYLHAPLFHPALKKVVSVRRELGTKTFFNMLGPLLNPSKPKNHLLGVSDLQVARLYHYLYQQTENDYAIIHSLDGYDEISLTSDLKCYTRQGEKIYPPEALGSQKIDSRELIGGRNTEENTRIFVDILSGKGTSAQNTVVLTNAAFALGLLNGEHFECNYVRAEESLKSGRAKNVLKKFLDY